MARLRWGLWGLGCSWLACSGVAVTMFGVGVGVSGWQRPRPPAVVVPPAPSAPRLNVIDGDTLDLGGTRFRLFGVDAPESGQTCTNTAGVVYDCGAVATQAMNQLVAGRFVTCLPRDKDRYGRTVAVCTVDRVDVGAALVSAGWALAYREYSTDYVDEEQAAKAGRLGMWAGGFTPPWEHRRLGR